MSVSKTDQFLEVCWLATWTDWVLTKKIIDEIKKEAFKDLYYSNIHNRIIPDGIDTLLQYTVWVETFDNIDDFFRNNEIIEEW